MKTDWNWQRNYLSQHSTKCLTLAHWHRTYSWVSSKSIPFVIYRQSTTDNSIIWVKCRQCRKEHCLLRIWGAVHRRLRNESFWNSFSRTDTVYFMCIYWALDRTQTEFFTDRINNTRQFFVSRISWIFRRTYRFLINNLPVWVIRSAIIEKFQNWDLIVRACLRTS